MATAIRSAIVVDFLGETLAIEVRIAAALRGLAQSQTAEATVTRYLGDLADIADCHVTALARRLAQLDGDAGDILGGDSTAASATSPSRALRAAFALLSEAVIAYTALGPMANRFRDSAIAGPEGMTGHLARDHSQHYLGAMGKISRLVLEATLAELSALGHECQCTCPACGLGTCVCGVGFGAAITEAWLAARPMPDAEARIPRPRTTSAAAAAGLQEGDLLVAADGAELTSYPQLQTTIKSHEMGDRVRLTIRRGSQTQEVDVTRFADLGDGSLPLDCEAPSGSVFYLDRARDLQQRLRKRRVGNSHGPSGLARLSARETQILRLLADGATNPMIAQKLRISRPTVARHVANILLKLDVTNRAEAAGIAAAAGLTSDN